MKKLLLSILLALGALIAPANAQQQGQALVVTTCGLQSLTAATYGFLTMLQNGELCTNATGGGGGGGAVFGPTAAGSAAVNPPVIVGGTADGTATGNVVNWKVLAGIGYINCANCSGSGVSSVDEAGFTAGISLFAGTGGFFQTTATSNPLANGQQGMFQVTANRALFSNLRNAAGAEIGVAAAPVQVSLANTAANAAAVLVNQPTGTNLHAVLDTTSTTAVTQATGTNLHAVVDSGSITANAGTNLNTSALATSALQGTNSATTAHTCSVVGFSEIGCLGQIDDDIKGTGTIQGTAANGAPVSGNPLQGGGRAQNAEITAVTNGQQVAAAFDLVGRQVVFPFANKENLVSGTTAAMTGTTSTQVLAAVASNKLYVTSISCVNSHATVGTFVTIQDGSGGTALATLAAGAVFGGDEKNGGGFPLFATTAGNGLFAANVTTGANVICNASGFKGT